jgi:hypothetical protein
VRVGLWSYRHSRHIPLRYHTHTHTHKNVQARARIHVHVMLHVCGGPRATPAAPRGGRHGAHACLHTRSHTPPHAQALALVKYTPLDMAALADSSGTSVATCPVTDTEGAEPLLQVGQPAS